MSYERVKYYQELGDYREAYRIALEDWKAKPNLKWPKNTIAWLLIRMMKDSAKAYGRDRFFDLMDEFGKLDIPKEETKLWGAVVWPIRDIISDSYGMQWFTPPLGDRIFDAIKEMPLEKPSESYTAVLKAFVQLGSLWPRLAEFIEWWGFENFSEFDYRRYPEKGILESTAERVFLAYVAAIGRMDKDPAQEFYKALENMAIRSQQQADNIYNALSLWTK